MPLIYSLVLIRQEMIYTGIEIARRMIPNFANLKSFMNLNMFSQIFSSEPNQLRSPNIA